MQMADIIPATVATCILAFIFVLTMLMKKIPMSIPATVTMSTGGP